MARAGAIAARSERLVSFTSRSGKNSTKTHDFPFKDANANGTDADAETIECVPSSNE